MKKRNMPKHVNKEGLQVARFFMVLASIFPLFILWAIRGNQLIPDRYFISFCLLMVAFPNAFLWYRIWRAKKQADRRELRVGIAEDHRSHILVYLFAMLLPLYSVEISTWRELGATVGALLFIVFLFWHLNLHYMNIVFLIAGYRVFTVYPPAIDNQFASKEPFVVITRRVNFNGGGRIVAYRISNTVYIEE